MIRLPDRLRTAFVNHASDNEGPVNLSPDAAAELAMAELRGTFDTVLAGFFGDSYPSRSPWRPIAATRSRPAACAADL